MRTRGARGFTLIEILTVIGIIMLLMTFTLWYVSGARHAVKLKSARADLTTLKTAIERYREIYGTFPDRRLPHAGGACRNCEVIRLLRNWQIDKPLSDPSGADKRFTRDAMLDKLAIEQIDAAGNWKDPWGSPYSINMIPDDVWRIYQRVAQARKQGAAIALDADEQALLAPYGSSQSHALYWIERVRSQVNMYSFGPDRACDWGYCFGDGSGYVKGNWDYYQGTENDQTPAVKRGDDIRP